MDANFWHSKWEKKEIAFHEAAANPLLLKYIKELGLAPGSRLFLPLCGKTLDIAWLLAQGYRVAGAELSKIAIDELFAGLALTPTIVKIGELEQYSAAHIDIFAGDIFALSEAELGAVDAIYDRAALVALQAELRHRYSAHLIKISHTAPQLLVCYEYEQSAQAGPPFSVSPQELEQHYHEHYTLKLLADTPLAGGLKGKCAAQEQVWLLTPK
ncbi:thiopurine S-methyltransferase [Undibacterium sp. Ren11W]|uniref:thiopurine S-methyltransferase n=1 Tax=Undibacterium sp. Ren11W TaxID=3413045 RepID=UPI003BF07D75